MNIHTYICKLYNFTSSATKPNEANPTKSNARAKSREQAKQKEKKTFIEEKQQKQNSTYVLSKSTRNDQYATLLLDIHLMVYLDVQNGVVRCC